MGRSDKAKWLIVVPAMLGIVFVTYVEHTTDIWGAVSALSCCGESDALGYGTDECTS